MSLHLTRLVIQPVAACAARCRRMLDALARLGRQSAGGLAPSPGVGSVEAAAATFGRLSRALRLIALLELRLRTLLAAGPTAQVSAAGRTEPASADAPPGGEPPGDPEGDDRKDAPDPVERPERLDSERPERFALRDLDDEIDDDARPLTEIVAAICRDLGLSREATLRAQAPFAELQALLAGEPPPERSRRHWDRASPGAPFLEATEPAEARRARVDARGPGKPP